MNLSLRMSLRTEAGHTRRVRLGWARLEALARDASLAIDRLVVNPAFQGVEIAPWVEPVVRRAVERRLSVLAGAPVRLSERQWAQLRPLVWPLEEG